MNKMVRKQVFITAEQNKRLKAHAAADGRMPRPSWSAPASICDSSRRRRRRTGDALAKLSGAWAERDDLDEVMREHRAGAGAAD